MHEFSQMTQIRMIDINVIRVLRCIGGKIL